MNIETNLGSLKLKNPITVASGTFGYGDEMAEVVNLNKIGAIAVKGLTLKPRKGNAPQRIVETPSGMINAVGLQNIGLDAFIREKIPFLEKYDLAVIANINGESIDDYIEIAKRLKTVCRVDALEINLSCPNVKSGGIVFGKDPSMVKKITAAVRENYDGAIITKLTPNVGDIVEIADAAKQAGADAVSLVNTFVGMSINPWKKTSNIAQGFGGLSGPAIKPIALKLVWSVYQNVDIPILGMGGIQSMEDVLSFLLVGSSAVAIGTGNFVDPKISVKLVEEMPAALQRMKATKVQDIIGKLKINN